MNNEKIKQTIIQQINEVDILNKSIGYIIDPEDADTKFSPEMLRKIKDKIKSNAVNVTPSLNFMNIPLTDDITVLRNMLKKEKNDLYQNIHSLKVDAIMGYNKGERSAAELVDDISFISDHVGFPYKDIAVYLMEMKNEEDWFKVFEFGLDNDPSNDFIENVLREIAKNDLLASKLYQGSFGSEKIIDHTVSYYQNHPKGVSGLINIMNEGDLQNIQNIRPIMFNEGINLSDFYQGDIQSGFLNKIKNGIIGKIKDHEDISDEMKIVKQTDILSNVSTKEKAIFLKDIQNEQYQNGELESKKQEMISDLSINEDPKNTLFAFVEKEIREISNQKKRMAILSMAEDYHSFSQSEDDIYQSPIVTMEEFREFIKKEYSTDPNIQERKYEGFIAEINEIEHETEKNIKEIKGKIIEYMQKNANENIKDMEIVPFIHFLDENEIDDYGIKVAIFSQVETVPDLAMLIGETKEGHLNSGVNIVNEMIKDDRLYMQMNTGGAVSHSVREMLKKSLDEKPERIISLTNNFGNFSNLIADHSHMIVNLDINIKKEDKEQIIENIFVKASMDDMSSKNFDSSLGLISDLKLASGMKSYIRNLNDVIQKDKNASVKFKRAVSVIAAENNKKLKY